MPLFHLCEGRHYEIRHVVMSKYNIHLHLVAVLSFQNLEVRSTCVWNVFAIMQDNIYHLLGA